MTPAIINQWIVGLLILTLATVLSIGVMLSLLVLWHRKRTRVDMGGIAGERMKSESSLFPRYGSAISEPPVRWFATRSNNVIAVQSALELHNPTPCSLGEGMANLSEHSLFIAPPFRGWILIVGQAVPDPADDVDECFRLVLRLSRALDHVQFFSVNRALNHHAWVRAEQGRIRRAYAWAGETLWNQGKKTDEEKRLKLRCFDYGESPLPVTFSANSFHSNAEKVGSLAALWSFDPARIDPAKFPARFGIAGDLVRA